MILYKHKENIRKSSLAALAGLGVMMISSECFVHYFFKEEMASIIFLYFMRLLATLVALFLIIRILRGGVNFLVISYEQLSWKHYSYKTSCNIAISKILSCEYCVGGTMDGPVQFLMAIRTIDNTVISIPNDCRGSDEGIICALIKANPRIHVLVNYFGEIRMPRSYEKHLNAICKRRGVVIQYSVCSMCARPNSYRTRCQIETVLKSP
jgi:hypothetical protein